MTRLSFFAIGLQHRLMNLWIWEATSERGSEIAALAPGTNINVNRLKRMDKNHSCSGFKREHV